MPGRVVAETEVVHQHKPRKLGTEGRGSTRPETGTSLDVEVERLKMMPR